MKTLLQILGVTAFFAFLSVWDLSISPSAADALSTLAFAVVFFILFLVALFLVTDQPNPKLRWLGGILWAVILIVGIAYTQNGNQFSGMF